MSITNDFSVLYLLGCNEGPSKRYRVFNHIESLGIHGITAEWIWDIDARIHNLEYLKSFSIVIVFRSGFNDRVDIFLKNLKTLNIPLVFDIDDLVFDPSVVDEIDVYRRMTDPAKQEYVAGIKSIRHALTQCDYVTTSTNFLASYLYQTFDRPTYVIPFGVNDTQVNINRLITGPFDGPKFIGYLSGTNTHQRDFEEAAAALYRILEKYDNVFLKVIGYLDVDKYFRGLEHKICRVDFLDWQYLVVEVSTFWVNIAPFEPSSLFCKAKSELKFVESALSRVPTIASEIPSFCAAIENGVNGYIAKTEDDWFNYLSILLENEQHRNNMAQEAYLTYARTYSPSRIGTKLIEVYNQIINIHRKIGPGFSPKQFASEMPGLFTQKGLRITWIIPQPFEASGGHRNIFRAIKYLSEFGHSCTLYVLPDNHRFADGCEVNAFITKEFFDIKCDVVVLGVDDICESDVMVCTYWTTAYVAEKFRHKTTVPVYFLQDYEPMFFPMGVDYVRALETYKFGYYFITSGPWPLKMVQQNFGVSNADFFRFPIDRGIYFSNDHINLAKSARVTFFARPDMPRRCYSLGVAALSELKKLRPEIEVVFYGDKAEKYSNVPFVFTNVGMTDTIEELGELYRSSNVGLCFSTTNPSLVPYEMMACGCPIVDLNINGNEINYDSKDNCVLVSAMPSSICDGILSIIDNKELASALSENGKQFVQQFPSEIEMAKLIESYIVTEYKRVKATKLIDEKIGN